MNANHLRQSLNRQKLQLQDLSTVIGDEVTVEGRIPINGSGEAFCDVNFPIKFTTLPGCTFGFELKEGEGILEGYSPTGTAHVAEFKTIEKLPVSVLYTGAKIRTVTTGLFYQKMVLTYKFTGRAITNPS